MEPGTGRLINCTHDACPYRDIGTMINRAPFYVSPWAAAIRGAASEPVKSAATELLLSANAEISWGAFADPWRDSQLNTARTASMFESSSYINMKAVFDACGAHPNRAADLRIPYATGEYYARGLDLIAQRFLHDEIDLATFQQEATATWEQLNAKHGVVDQHQAYRRSLGLQDATTYQLCQAHRTAMDTLDATACAEPAQPEEWAQILGIVSAGLLGGLMTIGAAHWSLRAYQRHQQMLRDSRKLIDLQVKKASTDVLTLKAPMILLRAADFVQMDRLAPHEQLRDRGLLHFYDALEDLEASVLTTH
eukprot:7386397-Prymnesium_polylepis.3